MLPLRSLSKLVRLFKTIKYNPSMIIQSKIKQLKGKFMQTRKLITKKK